MMKIHAIQTGVVRVRARQREGVGTGTRRRLNTMLDREWTDWLPIYAFAIEHPDGVIVVDTGETTAAGDRATSRAGTRTTGFRAARGRARARRSDHGCGRSGSSPAMFALSC